MTLVFTTPLCRRLWLPAPISISYLCRENSGAPEPIGQVRLAWARLYAASNFRTHALSEAQKLAEASARRAVALDVADADAHASLAHALEFRGDLEGALAEAERALTLAPNLAEANEKLGSALTMSGRPGEGLAALRTSIELDPRGPRLRMRLHQLT